ncbi:hypothetical protein [Uliginosibacterium gangwonense]|uniref:hypothetical protein n=1 Tax=Uliginosibacterium gangwonense TaxID=392736 RepID=UPI001FE22240|nr:hypothetical protein [Uliginosibacterium gangwonense]
METRNTAILATQNTGHGEVLPDGPLKNAFGIETSEDVWVWSSGIAMYVFQIIGMPDSSKSGIPSYSAYRGL